VKIRVITCLGFLLVAFDTSDYDHEKALGTFSADGENAKAIDCLGGSGVNQFNFLLSNYHLLELCLYLLQNAATHVSNDTKTAVELTWIPPKGYLGQVIFK
jgi:predicted nucleic acid-binding protein